MEQKNRKKQRTVFLAAGGTGGHLFPAEALAQLLIERGYIIHLLTDIRGRRFIEPMEQSFAKNKIHLIHCANLSSKNPLRLLRNSLQLIRGFWQSLFLIRYYRPSLMVGFGGYPTLPPLFAARFMRVPILLHEQNAIMGRANRLIGAHAKAIAAGFPLQHNAAFADKTHLVGNPLRASVFKAAQQTYRLAKAQDPFTLLVFGGSQGAHFFSEIIPQALMLLGPKLRQRLVLIQQVRSEDEEALSTLYRKLGIKAEIAVFFKNLPDLMAKAQFIVARAGASTIAELAAVGRPALLVPYPNALDKDQKYNARALAAAGGADVIEQADLTAKKLAALLTKAMELPQVLSRKAAAAKAFAKYDAVKKMADLAEAQMTIKD